MQRKVGLAVDEGLKRIAQVGEGKIGQPARDFAIRRSENVVEAGSNERIEVSAPDIGRFERRPGHGKWVHAVAVLELMGNEAAVLTAAARDDDIVFAIAFPV